MNYCINPECKSRENPDNVNICQYCGNILLINNRYRLSTQLSNNYYTCTQVFEVEDSQNQGRQKILKAIYNNGIQLSDGREFFADLIRLFRREQSILIDLAHPGIPRGEAYFSLSLNNGQELHCLVMEKIEGQNLEQWLGEHGAINEKQALKWLKQLATILDFIHQQNWFHRDIKPSNIMRRPNGQLVLIDFGTVRQITGTVVSRGHRTEVWSHGYTPPEQIDGRAVLQSDFYALGRTFVHLLTGIPPSEIQPDISIWQRSIRYPISDSLVNLINRLMASERSRRPKNAKAILGRLTLIRLEYKIQRLLRRFWLSGRRMLRRFWLIAGLVLVSGLIGAAIAVYIYSKIYPPVPPVTACDSSIGDSLSFGEEILVSEAVMNPIREKEEGIAKVATCDYSIAAVKKLEEAWGKQRDPETLIYLNNAKINYELNKQTIQANEVYTIAVVAPVKFTPDPPTASQGLELLRGVAQAQDEAIKIGIYLKVLIANDANRNDRAKEIAEKLINKPGLLAVVGHYSSDQTRVALLSYEKKGLVLVSPTSTSVTLRSNFFFRTVPSDEIAAQTLAEYLNKQAKRNKIAILWTPGNYSESLKGKIWKFFKTAGDVVNDSQKFDLSSNNFNALVALDTAKKQGATAITLIPGAGTDTTFKNALEVIKSDKYPDLIMVAGDSLYIKRVLDEVGKMAVSRRLVVAIPWHRLSSPNPNFPELARNLWQTVDVSWRTATAYDATRLLIEAMKKQPNRANREGVHKILSTNQFTVPGSATGEIKFEGSDRAKAESTLVTVVPYCSPISGYYFVPIDYLPKLPNQANGVKCFPLNPNQ